MYSSDRYVMVQSVVLANKVTLCKSFLQHATGLMFRRPKGAFAYVFPFNRLRHVSVTMIFVFFPIDVLFLDNENRIVDMKENLRPFSNYSPTKMVKAFIEFPKGTIAAHSMQPGMKVLYSAKLVKFSS